MRWRNQQLRCAHCRSRVSFIALGLALWTTMELIVRDGKYEVRDQSRG